MFRELETYQRTLQSYIESTYHLSNATLVAKRRALLETPGAISQEPYLESTPRYMTGTPFRDLLGLPAPVCKLLTSLSSGPGPLLFDPPYRHQARALELNFQDPPPDLLVTTGTGSGKTETFLMPILASLYHEASVSPETFKLPGLRALVLYPMNALVNDQLGRIRMLLGDRRVTEAFEKAAGRPARFARYTGRTLFPGPCPEADDEKAEFRLGNKLKPLQFYTNLLDQAKRTDEVGERARALLETFKRQGRWPSKPDFTKWLGHSPSWHAGKLTRLHTLPHDAELLLRLEVQTRVPDLMLTNYSMLEYMLLRPMERGIWAQARAFYEQVPSARLKLILDEAHLYRGAQGTEVALLLRRLCERLGIGPERLHVICTSASFHQLDYARTFAAELSGKQPGNFEILVGEREPRLPSGPGTTHELNALAQVPLVQFQRGTPQERLQAVRPVLELNGSWPVDPGSNPESPEWLQRALFQALNPLAVTGRLLNLTSHARTPTDLLTEQNTTAAQQVAHLADKLFGPELDGKEGALQRRKATDALIELASFAREAKDKPPLLAARAHIFFRGLPGLWACLNPRCSELPEAQRGGPTGKLYAQPLYRCACSARVLELHTCRDCGVAVAIGYSDKPDRRDKTESIDNDKPVFLWDSEGSELDDSGLRLHKVQLLLEDPDFSPANPQPSATKPKKTKADKSTLDPLTGILKKGGSGLRSVWLCTTNNRDDKQEGCFKSCPRCTAEGDKISDHQTRGDEPFQELVSTQLLEQPPQPGSRMPLKGRKVLIFSDGRQSASRLAGKLEGFSLRDAVRPLLLEGFRILRDGGIPLLLSYAYPALLLGAAKRDVRLTSTGISDTQELSKLRTYAERVLNSPLNERRNQLQSFVQRKHTAVPEELLQALHRVLNDRYRGLEALALGTFTADMAEYELPDLDALPQPPSGITHRQLIDVWLRLAVRAGMLELPTTSPSWRTWRHASGLRRNSGIFRDSLTGQVQSDPFWKQNFGTIAGKKGPWLKALERLFAVPGSLTEDGFTVKADAVKLLLAEDVTWFRCRRCTLAQAASPAPSCIGCGEQELSPLEPDSDPQFLARAAHYRRQVQQLADDPTFAPHPFVAKEHSAAISEAQAGKLLSPTEEYELRFQDISPALNEKGEGERPVDVLSCTTTMEVGIDIGSLTGVALRNVPPGRASYQQRAGRAGRRGSSLATVIAFAGADSHDQRFFDDPEGMVSGPVVDPLLKLDNEEIVRRHAFALILSLYQQHAIPDSSAVGANVFMSLGRVDEFKNGPADRFSYRGLSAWLPTARPELDAALERIVPQKLAPEQGRKQWLSELFPSLLQSLQHAGLAPDDGGRSAPLSNTGSAAQSSGAAGATLPGAPPPGSATDVSTDDDASDLEATQLELPNDPQKLLDRLFAFGLLPRYAFPTDVVGFHVFDPAGSDWRYPKLKFTPRQGLSVALSQYAPGREVWVDGKKYYSFALWDRFQKHEDCFEERLHYRECQLCGHVEDLRPVDASAPRLLTCPACSAPQKFGPVFEWFTPPGFACPVGREEGGLLEDQEAPPNSRPTAPRLLTRIPEGAPLIPLFDGRVQAWVSNKQELLVTNTGPVEDEPVGFRYCQSCGRMEPGGWPKGPLESGREHEVPYPSKGIKRCRGQVSTAVLGHRYKTDIAVLRLKLGSPVSLPPGSAVARVALKSLAEALAAAACKVLSLESGELSAEPRMAQTAAGRLGHEAEIFFYDAVPGGAGYSQEAVTRLGELFAQAAELLEKCPGGCDQSCYRCLRSWQNRWLHSLLDRHLALDLLKHIQAGEQPQLLTERRSKAAETMRRYLDDEGRTTRLNGERLEVDGRAVWITHSLTPNVAPSDCIAVSHLLASRALPKACRDVLSAIDGSTGSGRSA